MTMDNTHKKLAVAMCEYLKQCMAQDMFRKDDAEGLEVAVQCIQEAFQIDPTEPNFDENYSIKPATLKSVFDVFVNTQQKVNKPQPPKEGSSKSAEEWKALGNKKMAEREFVGAIECYTQAIGLAHDNAVYYANRAAAYSQNNQHELAVKDAKQATVIDPDYSKAYSRMGHAHFCLGEFKDAVEAYTRGLELDPGNAAMKQSLAVAQQKWNEVSNEPATSRSAVEDPMGALGGMGDMGSMFNNPGFMDMASKMMSNPNFQQMLSNPAIASMAQNLMSNPAALQGLLGNPEMAKMASTLMNNKEK